MGGRRRHRLYSRPGSRLYQHGRRGFGRLLGALLTRDPLMVLAVGTLASLGLLNLLAVGDQGLAAHQLISVLAGLALFAAMQRLRSPDWPVLGRVIYLVAASMLVAVATVGVTANGARRWLLIGSIVLQPSELAKVGLLLVLADVLGKTRPRWPRLGLALALAAIPVALTVVQPDLSTAGLLLVVTLSVLVLARVRLRALAALALAAFVLAPLAARLVRPYQMARFQAFLSGGHDPLGAGWSILQAKVAVASGGTFGIAGVPFHELLAQYLPARETDLAFASLVEQWGLLAGVCAISAVLVLVWRLVATALLARTPGTAVMAAGLAVLLGVEAAVSVAGNLGKIPLAGVPFPLISFGGSAAAAHLAALGLVLGARRDADARRLWQPVQRIRGGPRLMRATALALAVVLATLAGLTRHFQEAEGIGLREFAMDEITRCVRLEAPRGMVLDRHGTPLARNDQTVRVAVVPAILAHDRVAAVQLATLLSVTPASLERAISSSRQQLSVQVAEIPAAKAEPLAAAHLPGVILKGPIRRAYPYGPALAPLLGFTGVATPAENEAFGPLAPGAIVGRSGLERQYDRVLRGRDGYQCLLVNPLGIPVAMGELIPPVAGGDLLLSLDVNLQMQATTLLHNALKGVRGQPRGDEGAALVLDPRTGEVLAMASLPSYDNNLFGPPLDTGALRQASLAPGDPMLSHATQVAVPPGSTFKLVVAAADTAYNAIPPNWVIPTGYTMSLGNHIFHGWAWLPPQNLAQAIAWSNDVYFYKLALALGADHMIAAAQALGVGEKTGIDLPGEASGYLGTPDSVGRIGATWYPGSTVILGIGQGYITTTPLQVARFTAGVATGALVTPRLGLGFRQAAGDPFTALPGQPPQPLAFARTLGPVREGMRMAVTQGTASLLRGLPVTSGGKTGTAEDPSTHNGATDAWFTAVAPMEQPEVTTTMLVRGGGEGFYTAEPAVAEILAYYFTHRQAIQARPVIRPPTAAPVVRRERVPE